MKEADWKYKQIADEIEQLISTGQYQNGQKLESIRNLSKRYRVSISTAQNVYQELVIRGYIHNIPRSGNYVVETLPESNMGVDHTGSSPSRDEHFAGNLNAISGSSPKRLDLSEFNVAAPGDLIISQKLLLRTMQQVITEQGARLLRYYPSNGSEELRVKIAARAASYGTMINPKELIITDGALQALYIALASCCSESDIVAVQSPCVFSILQVIQTLKLKVIEIPLSHTDEDFTTQLSRLSNEMSIAAVVITANFHNPTGASMTDEQKQELVNLCQLHQITVIENDIYSDLYFQQNRPKNLKSFDQSGIVLTYSSYSKTLAAGIRLGWLDAGRYFDKAEQIKFSLGSTVSPVYQQTVLKLLSNSSYERHLRQFRRKISEQCKIILQLLSVYMPETITFTKPEGGYGIWLQLDNRIDTDLFDQYCTSARIRFTPGESFSTSGKFKNCFRLIFADLLSSQKQNDLINLGKWMQNQLNTLQ